MHPRRLLPGALVGLVTFAACGDTTAPQLRELEHAERLWSTHGSGPYTMQQQRLCFCPNTDTYQLTVVNEHVTAAVNLTTGLPATTAELASFKSVSELFALIRATLRDDRAGRSTIAYDAGAGYPAEVSLDPIRDAVDDEITYRSARVATQLN